MWRYGGVAWRGAAVDRYYATVRAATAGLTHYELLSMTGVQWRNDDWQSRNHPDLVAIIPIWTLLEQGFLNPPCSKFRRDLRNIDLKILLNFFLFILPSTD
jgi:hypothetical protein